MLSRWWMWLSSDSHFTIFFAVSVRVAVRCSVEQSAYIHCVYESWSVRDTSACRYCATCTTYIYVRAVVCVCCWVSCCVYWHYNYCVRELKLLYLLSHSFPFIFTIRIASRVCVAYVRSQWCRRRGRISAITSHRCNYTSNGNRIVYNTYLPYIE